MYSIIFKQMLEERYL